MKYAEWCGVRRQAHEAVQLLCKSVADELGIECIVEKAFIRGLVAHPEPKGFTFSIRWGHLEEHDNFTIESFVLPPDSGQWPIWLDYLGYVMRFHWTREKIGDRALCQCLGEDPEIDAIDIAEKAESV